MFLNKDGIKMKNKRKYVKYKGTAVVWINEKGEQMVTMPTSTFYKFTQKILGKKLAYKVDSQILRELKKLK